MKRLATISGLAVVFATTIAVGSAEAVVYCKSVGVPKGCVARPHAGVGAPGVGARPGVGAGAAGVGVAPGVGVGAPGAGVNAGGPVNRRGPR